MAANLGLDWDDERENGNYCVGSRIKGLLGLYWDEFRVEGLGFRVNCGYIGNSGKENENYFLGFRV